MNPRVMWNASARKPRWDTWAAFDTTLILRETSNTGYNREVEGNPIKRSLHLSSVHLKESFIPRRKALYVKRRV